MNLAAVILLAALSMGDDRAVLAESVDVVELNHFYDSEGGHVLDQIVFYRWQDARHQVVDFRVVKSPECLPVRQGSYWACLWNDGPRLRLVRAASFRESWTQYDPELVEREYFPKEYRRGLRMR